MKKISKKGLNKILKLHGMWLNNEDGGKRADLRSVNLTGEDLRNTCLRYANLEGAILRDVDLRGAELNSANLMDANLRNANLTGAILKGVCLRGADLENAILRGTNLSYANLKGTDLTGVKTNNLTSGYNMVCPIKGSYIAYKKANVDEEKVIVELKVLENAKRSSATSRKCRCSEAEVLSITSIDEKTNYNKAYSNYDKSFIYEVGKIARVYDFDYDRWAEFTTGIHHFMTREEAVNY